MSDIKDLQEKVAQFIAERDWNQFHSPKNIAMSIAIESAELMEIFQWRTIEESQKTELLEAKREDIEDEVADIMIYLLSFVNVTKIDLYKAVVNKIDRNQSRFPIEKVLLEAPITATPQGRNRESSISVLHL